MEDRCILHCDLNNFFASVECLSHPEWKDVPMAVCGSVEDRHGIVLAKNEPAKKFKIKTAETVSEAKKKCPSLIIAPPHFEKYIVCSEKVRKIYNEYTDQVESFGIDECWLDVTGSRRLFGNGRQIADQLRSRIASETGLTISAGVSFTKTFAKLASDLKKPDATVVIPRSEYQRKIWPLPCGTLLFAGKATVEKLSGIGIYTIGNLARISPDAIKCSLGKPGLSLYRAANGMDLSPVHRLEDSAPPKSIGRSVTCMRDLVTPTEVWRVLLGLAERVSKKLREGGYCATEVHVSCRDSSLGGFGLQRKLVFPSRLAQTLAKEAFDLLLTRWDARPLRSVGITAAGLYDDSLMMQRSLFFDDEKAQKQEQIETEMDLLRVRFGKAALVRASQMIPLFDDSNGGGHCSFSYMTR